MDNINCFGHRSIIVFIFTDIIDHVFIVFLLQYIVLFWGAPYWKNGTNHLITISLVAPYVEISLLLCAKMHILCRFKIRFNVIV